MRIEEGFVRRKTGSRRERGRGGGLNSIKGRKGKVERDMRWKKIQEQDISVLKYNTKVPKRITRYGQRKKLNYGTSGRCSSGPGR